MGVVLALIVAVGTTIVPPPIPNDAVVLVDLFKECKSGHVYKRLLDTDRNGRPDIATFGRVRAASKGPQLEDPLMTIYYDQTKTGLEQLRDVYLTFPGKAVERIVPSELFRRYQTTCGLIDP